MVLLGAFPFSPIQNFLIMACKAAVAEGLCAGVFYALYFCRVKPPADRLVNLYAHVALPLGRAAIISVNGIIFTHRAFCKLAIWAGSSDSASVRAELCFLGACNGLFTGCSNYCQ